MAPLAGSHTVVPVAPLFDDGPDAMVALAHRFGRYRTYATHERVDHPLGRGLQQRHDTILNFLKTGGLRAATDDPTTLAARTAYFREEYGYGAQEHIAGIGSFLGSERLADAAREVHGRPVVAPAIAYANLMVPGQELAVHTDVPEFRGADRKRIPQWLLVVMHHSGLFEPWRLHIATGIAWFHDSDHGALAYWPDGPDAPGARHRISANTALVLDTDTVFHGVDRVTDASAAVVPPVTPSTTLAPTGPVGAPWALTDRDGEEVAVYAWDELRFSVSWKAYCFEDEAACDAWRTGATDLDEAAIIDTLVEDLVARGLADPDVARDGELGLLLIDTYVRFPTAAVASA